MQPLENRRDQTVAIILAGGMSQRMGFPKMLLPYSDSKTFVEQIICEYKMMPNMRIILVCNTEVRTRYGPPTQVHTDVSVVYNPHPSFGRMYSLHLGLAHTEGQAIIIQNIDNPFVTHELLSKMIDIAPLHGYVSPRINGKGGHPVMVCGSAVDAIRTSSIHDTLRDVLRTQHRVDLNANDERLLANVDTPEIYTHYFSHVALNKRTSSHQ